MSAASYCFRAELRSGGWRFVVGTAVLLGLGGGTALLATAGTRRTASAFERLERATLSAHVLINPDNQEITASLTDGRLADIEGIEGINFAHGLLALFDGHLTETATIQPTPGNGTNWFSDIDRPVVREGRLPDQSRPDEAFASPAGARSAGLDVGDTFELTILSFDDLDAIFEEPGDGSSVERIERAVADGLVGHRITTRLVGIGVTAADVVPGGELDAVYLTRALSEQERFEPLFGGISVRLVDGTDGVDRFIAEVRTLVPPGSTIDFQTLASDRATVHRAVTPQVIAMAVIAAVMALGSVLAIGQSLGRRATQGADDDVTLAGLGMTSSERRQVDWMRLLSVLVLGTLLAIAVAAAVSPTMPMGLARDIEPSPGWSFDAVTLLAGGAVLAILAFVVGGLFTFRARRDQGRTPRPSVLAAWLRSHTPSGPASFGVGLALEPGQGRTSVPTRSTLTTAAIGIAALIASLTFAASLDRLVSTPRDYGSNFNAMVLDNDLEGREREAYAAMTTLLDAAPEVESWSLLYAEQVELPSGVVAVNAVGFEKSDTASPTLVKGRFPTRADEIALGAITMRREGVGIGDQIEVGRQTSDDPLSLTVVGQVVLPGVASYLASDQAALGVGAMLSLEGLAAVTGATSYGDPESSETTPDAVLVTLRDGTTPAELEAQLLNEAGPETFLVDGPIRSSDIASLERVRATPTLLASLLALVAAVAVGHALVVAVQRRRRDLAVLRTVGFSPGQVSRTVAWQATTVAVVATVIGVPLGLLAGRIAWGAVCHQLGVVNHPATPIAAVALALPLAIVFANLTALLPGWRAARTRPTDILRAQG